MEVVVTDVRRWPGVAAGNQTSGPTRVDGNRTVAEICGETAVSVERAAKCAALGAGAMINAELSRVTAAWPDLPPVVRNGMLAMIDSVIGGNNG